MANQDEAEHHLQSGNTFYEQGNYAKAIEHYQKATEIRPDYAIAYNNWGLALSDLKQYEKAIEQYKNAINVDSNYADAYNQWGLALYNLEQYEEAIEQFEKATKADSKLAIAYFSWGLALANLKRYEEAIEQYEKATKADSNDADTYTYAFHNIADLLEQQGKYKAAREEWEKAWEAYKQNKQKAKNSNNADYFQYFGGMLHEVFGELNEAKKIYREGLTLDPNHAGILIGLVNLYLEKKDEVLDEKITDYWWKAREKYKRAEGILKDQLKKAECISEDQIKKAEQARTFHQLGQLYLKMEEYPEAEKSLLDALERDRDLAETYTNLGVVYARKEDFKKAIEYFKGAYNLDRHNLTVWSNLAEVYLKASDLEEGYLKAKPLEKAEAEYKKILGITSYHVESQIGLGEVYAAMGDTGDGDMYDQAIRHFDKAMKIARSNKASKRLKKNELAAVFYSRGYARVKLYEVSMVIGDESLLQKALKDFKECLKNDRDHHKARRAAEKIEKRLSRFSPRWLTEKIGPLLIFFSALAILTFSQCSFHFGKPNKSIKNAGEYALLTFGSLAFSEAKGCRYRTGKKCCGSDKDFRDCWD